MYVVKMYLRKNLDKKKVKYDHLIIAKVIPVVYRYNTGIPVNKHPIPKLSLTLRNNISKMQCFLFTIVAEQGLHDFPCCGRSRITMYNVLNFTQKRGVVPELTPHQKDTLRNIGCYRGW
jgi:hypothetical protein